MKYETPEVTALTTAINAIQGDGTPKDDQTSSDNPPQFTHEHSAAYADWE
jgi:hypothetical protein